MELTAFDGPTVELPADSELIKEFGCPTGGTRPSARIVTLVPCGGRRVRAATTGAYRTGEQELTDRLDAHLAPGTLNLADRNSFGRDRWLRFAATGAQPGLAGGERCEQPARPVIERLFDGSHLVRLRESDVIRARRRKEGGAPHAERLPDTVARLVEFDVAVTDMRGRRLISRRPAADQPPSAQPRHGLRRVAWEARSTSFRPTRRPWPPPPPFRLC